MRSIVSRLRSEEVLLGSNDQSGSEICHQEELGRPAEAALREAEWARALSRLSLSESWWRLGPQDGGFGSGWHDVIDGMALRILVPWYSH